MYCVCELWIAVYVHDVYCVCVQRVGNAIVAMRRMKFVTTGTEGEKAESQPSGATEGEKAEPQPSGATP